MKPVLLVLAAGRSRRMGRPKALLEAEGRSFVQWITTTAIEAGVEKVLVTVESRNSEVAKVLERDFELIVNDRPEQGPVGGIKSASARLVAEDAGTYMVVWPVDCPFVSVNTVRTLIAAASGDKVAVPIYKGRPGHPVVFGPMFISLFVQGWPDTARDVIEYGERVGRLVRVKTEDQHVLDDIDELSDYVNVLEVLRKEEKRR